MKNLTRKKGRKLKLVIAGVIALVFATVCLVTPKYEANAAGGFASSVTEKAKRKGVEKCLGYGLIGTIESVRSYTGADSVFPKTALWTDDSGSNAVKMPYLYGNSYKEGYVSCRDLVVKDIFEGKIPKKLNQTGLSGSAISTSEDAKKIDEFLTAMGYTSEDIGEETKFACYSFKFKFVPKGSGAETKGESGKACFRVDGNNMLIKKGDKYDINVDSSTTTGNEFFDLTISPSGNKIATIGIKFTKLNTSNITSFRAAFETNGSVSINDVKSKLDNFISNNNLYGVGLWMQQHDLSDFQFDSSSISYEGSDTQVVDKKYNYRGVPNAGPALQYATGKGEIEDYTAQERNWMNYDLLKDSKYFNALVTGDCGDSIPSGYYLQYYDKNNQKSTYCSLNAERVEAAKDFKMKNHSETGIFGISNSGNQRVISLLSVTDVLDALNSINLASYCGEDPDFPLCKANPTECDEDPTLPGCSDGPTGTAQESMDDDACYQHAKSLGWIICPIINGMHDVATTVYHIIEPLTAVNEHIIDQMSDGTGNVYTAWVQFRDMANIAFVIFFMIVIFSQLTGYGIDNYGVKKLLPKLIVTAILVNLSYVICAVAVDFSNIVGNGIQGLFNSISVNAGGEASSMEVFTKATTAIVVDALAAGGAAYGVTVLTGTLFGGWALIIPILLYLLTVVISIIFAWIVLGLRQALVVILIVLSPVALVLMALPNTEKFFKKYLDLFKGILMVYPVVGALIGAGTFTGSLLILDENPPFTMFFIAGLLCVVPYFLIPSLTRKSLDALGGIGTRIAGIGNRLGGSASHAIRNSDLAQTAMQSSKASGQQRYSKLWMARRGNDILDRLNKGEKISASEAARLKKHSVRAFAEDSERIAAAGAGAQYRRMIDGSGYDAALAGIRDKEFEQAVKDQDTLFATQHLYDDLEKRDDNDMIVPKTDPNGRSRFQRAIEEAAMDNSEAGRIRLEALMRKAANGSDEQRKQLRQGMDRAILSGQVSSDTAYAYGNHLQTNGVYKAQDYSMFAQGQNLTRSVLSGMYNAAGPVSPNLASTGAANLGKMFNGGKVSADKLFNLDDNEFEAILNGVTNGTITDTETLAKINKAFLSAGRMYEADTSNKFTNVKEETINQINKILAATSGATFSPVHPHLIQHKNS